MITLDSSAQRDPRESPTADEQLMSRASQLEELSAALITALTPEQVTDVVVRRALPSLRAQVGLVNLLTEDEQALHLVGATGYADEALRRLPVLPLSASTPTADAVLNGRAIWLESTDALADNYPHLDVRHSQTSSVAFAILPLRGTTRIIGALLFGFAEAQRFAAPDRWFIQALAQQCALALERARLHAQESAAREAAERAQSRLVFLAGASATLAKSLDYDQTLQAVAHLIVPTVADWCAVDIQTEGRLERAITAHLDPVSGRSVLTVDGSESVAGPTAALFAQAVKDRRTLLETTLSAETPLTAIVRLRQLPFVSRMSVPLAIQGEAFGMLTLGTLESCRLYDEHDLSIVDDLAYRIAVALENNRLYRATRETSRRVQRHAERLQALSEISRKFAETTLHLPKLLDAILGGVVGPLGDSCIICRIAADGQLVPIASRHSSPEITEVVDEFLRTNPLHVGEGLQGEVAATGIPLMVTQVQSLWSDRPEPPWWSLFSPYGEAALVIVPLRRDRLLGTMLIARDPSWPEISAEEQLFLQDVADRAALSLDNSDLHQRLTEREQRLQDLVKKLITSQEEERRRVAYEVHDGLAQVAVATHQHLQAYASRYRPHGAVGREALERVVGLAKQTVDEARQVIANSRPLILDDFGLASALHTQIDALERAGWQVTYCENLGAGRLPALIETTLFRVAQETLNNARKHARTTKVRIDLERDRQAVWLIVQDWGCGFAPDAVVSVSGPGERVGLLGMRERIMHVNGDFRIESAVGKGTRVSVRIPLQLLNDEQDERDTGA